MNDDREAQDTARFSSTLTKVMVVQVVSLVVLWLLERHYLP